MKVAATYEDGVICQHFGHTPAFKVYDIQDGAVVSSEIITPDPDMHCALGGWLGEHGVEALICGGIGGGARVGLGQAGIQIFPGISGDPDQAAQALAAGTLEYDPNAQCADHGHGHGHDHGHECNHS